MYRLARAHVSESEAIAKAKAVVAGAGEDAEEIVQALLAAGLLATRHERGTVCGYEDCHPVGEPLEPCSWVDSDSTLLAHPGERVFSRFTAAWIEEDPVENPD